MQIVCLCILHIALYSFAAGSRSSYSPCSIFYIVVTRPLLLYLFFFNWVVFCFILITWNLFLLIFNNDERFIGCTNLYSSPHKCTLHSWEFILDRDYVHVKIYLAEQQPLCQFYLVWARVNFSKIVYLSVWPCLDKVS